MIHGETDVLHLVYAVTPLDGYVDLDDMGMAYVPSVEDQVRLVLPRVPIRTHWKQHLLERVLARCSC
jgi:hypothetical protein